MAGTPSVVTILHTNDLHGHVLPWSGWEGELSGKRVGGFDRLATAVWQVRAEMGPDQVLLLDAGDTLSDTLIGRQTTGRAILELMNFLRYDAMAVGNHDLDFTVETLREQIREARFAVLAANLVDRDTRRGFTRSYLIREVGGVKVGILGLAYPNTALTSSPRNVTGLEFREGAATANELIPLLRRDGAELVVVLSHLGLSADKQLAERVRGIDVIVSGHSHNRMRAAMRVRDTLIVQAGAHGSDLGRLDLTVHNGHILRHASRLITLDHALIEPDAEMQHLISSLTAPFCEELDERIGEAAQPIVRAQTLAGQEPGTRDAESPADALFADILREETRSDIALLPGLGYGVAIPRGPITAAQLHNLIPHDTAVVVLQLSGSAIHAILEQTLQNILSEDPSERVGGIIQVSGLNVRYDPHGSVQRRVREVSVNNESLKPDRLYRVATISSLANGGYNYRTFGEGRAREEYGDQYLIIRDWISRHGPVKTPPLGHIQKIPAED